MEITHRKNSFCDISVCQANESDLDGNGMRMTKIAWLYYINKYIELLDTVFFVMRKKWNQVSFLHVYHHAIMPIWAYNQVMKHNKYQCY